MDSSDIRSVMERPADFTSEDGRARFWMLMPFEAGMCWAGTFTGQSPWTRHPDGDALVHVLEGESDVTVLEESGPSTTVARAGSVFVVPRQTWYRQLARRPVLQWGAAPAQTEHSEAEDPRSMT
jgi:uncharacterized cupin superfamily protein